MTKKGAGSNLPGKEVKKFNPLAGNPRVTRLQKPTDSLKHLEQKSPMSCSLASIKMASHAFGKKTGSESAMLKKAQERKKGTYNVSAKGKGIPNSTVSHTEGFGAYSADRTRENVKKISERGHIPLLVTEKNKGYHVMPVRPGTPQGHPGRLQLFDPMAAKPTLKSYESVLEGNPFSSGRLGGQSAHSLYGIAPERNAVRKRSASTSSLESTDEGLTKSRKGGLIKR